MSSAMPNTLGKSMNISFIFFWKMSANGAAPNGSLTNLYLAKWHANIVNTKIAYQLLGCGNLS